jgi:hypothetical protein
MAPLDTRSQPGLLAEPLAEPRAASLTAPTSLAARRRHPTGSAGLGER